MSLRRRRSALLLALACALQPAAAQDGFSAAGSDNGGLAGPGSTGALAPETSGWVTDPSDQDDLFAIENMLYRQEDGGDQRGGNPFIDEDAAIFESLILVSKRLDEYNVVSLRGLVDVISAASYDAVTEVTSGASGTNPGRFGARIDWDFEQDGRRIQLNRDYGAELFYRSNNFGVALSETFAEGNTTVGLRAQRYNDHLRNVRFDGIVLLDQPRTTRTYELSVDQVVSPRARVLAMFTYTDQYGFLSTSFNAVRVAGGPDPLLPEALPGDRHRRAGTLRYKRAMGRRDAGEVGYRYYEDDWGIDAHTLEFRYVRPIGDGSTILEPNVRYYDQSESDFFATQFATPQAFMTSDPDLGGFQGRSVGLDATFLEVPFLGTTWEMNVGINAYDRSDGLDILWLTFGGSFRF